MCIRDSTQGVRIMKTDDDQIAAVVRIPPEEISEEDEAVAQANQSVEAETDTPETPTEDSVDESAEE